MFGEFTMEYDTLVCYNNWGIDEWYFKSDWLKHFAEPDGEYKHGSDTNLMRKKRVDFKNGQSVRVKWPDESESVEVITLSGYSGVVSDHGNDTRVQGENPTLSVNYRGLELLVGRQRFQALRFSPDDFTTGREYLEITSRIEREREEYAQRHK